MNMNKTNIVRDVWKSPKEACDILGEGWIISEGFVVKHNDYGAVIAKQRIFNGDEHLLSQPGMVVFREDDPRLYLERIAK